jgi:hypothetical protein
MYEDRVLELAARARRLAAALKWIRFEAGLHYLGQAFDPEHMRSIANMAADALGNRAPELPDFDEAMKEAQAEGARLAQELAAYVDEEEPDD